MNECVLTIDEIINSTDDFVLMLEKRGFETTGTTEPILKGLVTCTDDPVTGNMHFKQELGEKYDDK